MTNTLYIVVLLSAAAGVCSAYWGPDLPPGPYCGSDSRAQCCTGRQDGCAHRILNTLCYCDDFCNRTRSHDDCCPDYAPVCLGVPTPTPPPEHIKQPCRHGGKLYFPGDTWVENCNICTCVEDAEHNTSKKQCDADPCIISDDVIYGVNQPGNSWRAYNYSQFAGKKLKDGLIYKLGTFPLSRETKRMNPIRYDKDIHYDSHFDSRVRWPLFISPILDQGWCGSDWAVSIASIASDRFAIQSNGAEKRLLSAQTLLSCNRRQQRGCHGGNIDVAWNFAREHGLVEADCFPYKGALTSCPYRPSGNLLSDGCPPALPQRTSRYKVGPPGRLKTEEDIMYDIMTSGPVHAIMTVYQDFFHYRDGVYRHTTHGDNQLQGLHSVKIVGWGEERGDKYWIVANSWGTAWGLNGYFHIARGSNESGIESFVVTVLTDVTEAYQRK